MYLDAAAALVGRLHVPAALHPEVVAVGDVGHDLRGLEHQPVAPVDLQREGGPQAGKVHRRRRQAGWQGGGGGRPSRLRQQQQQQPQQQAHLEPLRLDAQRLRWAHAHLERRHELQVAHPADFVVPLPARQGDGRVAGQPVEGPEEVAAVGEEAAPELGRCARQRVVLQVLGLFR